MPIEELKNNNGEVYYGYVPLSSEDSYKEYKRWMDVFWHYSDANELPREMIRTNTAALGELITRVDKRKEYFIVFCEGTKLSDIREAALVAYWILKLKPFFVCGDDPMDQRNTLRINEGFAAYIIFSALKAHSKREKLKFSVSEAYKDKLLYAIRYWDFSKEALMMLAESLCEQMRPASGDESV